MSHPASDRSVLLETRDLFFRGKLQGLLEALGYEVTRRPPARHAIVELSGEGTLARVRELVEAGASVLAFGSHVRADLLREARDAGAHAVPNSQIEAAARARFGVP